MVSLMRPYLQMKSSQQTPPHKRRTKASQSRCQSHAAQSSRLRLQLCMLFVTNQRQRNAVPTNPSLAAILCSHYSLVPNPNNSKTCCVSRDCHVKYGLLCILYPSTAPVRMSINVGRSVHWMLAVRVDMDRPATGSWCRTRGMQGGALTYE